MISARTKSALVAAKARGVKLGRRRGSLDRMSRMARKGNGASAVIRSASAAKRNDDLMPVIADIQATGCTTPENVWSAARLQGKSEGWIDRSAQMYSAYRWRAESPGHDELRCVLFLINGTVIADHFREQVSSTPLGTVRSS
jgi:hypothetical protein